MSSRWDAFFEFLRRGLIEPLSRLGGLAVDALKSLMAGVWRLRWRFCATAALSVIAYGLYTHPPIEAVRRGEVLVRTDALDGSVGVYTAGTVLALPGIHVDFAGYAPGTRRLLVAREVRSRGRFRRSFEELRLDDLALVRRAGSPELLRDFGRWQDVAWRRDTLALH